MNQKKLFVVARIATRNEGFTLRKPYSLYASNPLCRRIRIKLMRNAYPASSLELVRTQLNLVSIVNKNSPNEPHENSIYVRL